jgi:hypothetical protein
MAKDASIVAINGENPIALCKSSLCLPSAAFTDQADNGKTESRHQDRIGEGVGRSGTGHASSQPAGSRAVPASHHDLGLHPNHLELASGLSYPPSSRLFSSNWPASCTSSSPATMPENGVIYPVHPFNHHAGQPVPPPPVTGSYLIYPVHPFNPHANHQRPPPPVAGSYLPPAMVYPTTGPSPDVLLSMLRMDPRYTGLFSYAPFSSAPVQQQQHGLALYTGPAHSGAPL